MKYVLMATALVIVTGCSNYTDKTSPCVGSNGTSMSFAPQVTKGAGDCVYRTIGS
jgi:hypothetical protein